jgi:hypothetical protein
MKLFVLYFKLQSPCDLGSLGILCHASGWCVRRLGTAWWSRNVGQKSPRENSATSLKNRILNGTCYECLTTLQCPWIKTYWKESDNTHEAESERHPYPRLDAITGKNIIKFHHNHNNIIIIIIIIIIMSCEALRALPLLYPSRWSLSFHLFRWLPMLLFPFGLQFSKMWVP